MGIWVEKRVSASRGQYFSPALHPTPTGLHFAHKAEWL